MARFIKPTPTNNEIILDPSKTVLSITNHKGIIKYINEDFVKISGYQEHELAGFSHNVIRHPDMPKTVFKFMWESLHKGENFYSVIKNIAKNGDYYWEISCFTTKYDEDGNMTHYARRKPVPIKIKEQFSDLYKKILAIEKDDLGEAYKFLHQIISSTDLTYNEFVLGIIDKTPEEMKAYFNN